MARSFIRNLLRSAAFIAVLTTAAKDGRAEIAPTTLKRLAAQSEVIVVARVDRVERIDDIKVAVATVLRSHQGLKAQQRFLFLAHPTWMCDASDAVAGEIVLLFLDRPPVCSVNGGFLKHRTGFESERVKRFPGAPFYQIAHSGVGRMPVHEINGTPYVLPIMHLGTIGGFAVKRTSAGQVSLRDMEALITRLLTSTAVRR